MGVRRDESAPSIARKTQVPVSPVMTRTLSMLTPTASAAICEDTFGALASFGNAEHARHHAGQLETQRCAILRRNARAAVRWSDPLARLKMK